MDQYTLEYQVPENLFIQAMTPMARVRKGFDPDFWIRVYQNFKSDLIKLEKNSIVKPFESILALQRKTKPSYHDEVVKSLLSLFEVTVELSFKSKEIVQKNGFEIEKGEGIFVRLVEDIHIRIERQTTPKWVYRRGNLESTITIEKEGCAHVLGINSNELSPFRRARDFKDLIVTVLDDFEWAHGWAIDTRCEPFASLNSEQAAWRFEKTNRFLDGIPIHRLAAFYEKMGGVLYAEGKGRIRAVFFRSKSQRQSQLLPDQQCGMSQNFNIYEERKTKTEK